MNDPGSPELQKLNDTNNTGLELPKCHPGAREAILRDITKWIEPDIPFEFTGSMDLPLEWQAWGNPS